MVDGGLCSSPMPAPAPGSDPALLPQPVQLYRLDAPDHHCPYGERARQLLKDRGIPFEDHRFTSQAEAEQFQAAHGVTSTPQVFAGSERIGGYSDLAVRLGVAAADLEPATGPGRSYRPVLAVFAVAALAAWALAIGVVGFMGLAVTVLATLKLMDPQAFRRAVDELVQPWAGMRIDKVAGMEARGFILGQFQDALGNLGAIPNLDNPKGDPIRPLGAVLLRSPIPGYVMVETVYMCF